MSFELQHARETSQLTPELDRRTQTNLAFGQVNLDDWLFERLDLSGPMRLLDVGCGTGHHLLALARRLGSGRFCGLDISATSTEEARRRAAEAGIAAEFVTGDAADPALFAEETFDRIISIYALYYAKNVPQILTRLQTKLAFSGRLAVMAPYHRNNEEWYRFLSAFMSLPAEIERVADEFMDGVVLPFARAAGRTVRTFDFANPIAIPSLDDLRRYWVSNVYYRPEHDAAFEDAARSWFAAHDRFLLTKRALLAVME